MDQSQKQNLLNVDTWVRLLFMILFAALTAIARGVVIVVALLQFGYVLLSGSDNLKLRQIGQIAGKWLLQAANFLTFNSEQKPFPFDDWPELDPEVITEPKQTAANDSAESAAPGAGSEAEAEQEKKAVIDSPSSEADADEQTEDAADSTDSANKEDKPTE